MRFPGSAVNPTYLRADGYLEQTNSLCPMTDTGRRAPTDSMACHTLKGFQCLHTPQVSALCAQRVLG